MIDSPLYFGGGARDLLVEGQLDLMGVVWPGLRFVFCLVLLLFLTTRRRTQSHRCKLGVQSLHVKCDKLESDYSTRELTSFCADAPAEWPIN